MDAMIRALERSEQGDHPSRHQWDMFALSALSTQEHEKLEAHLADCPCCRDTVAQIDAERDGWAMAPGRISDWQRLEAALQQPPSLWERLASWMRPAVLAPVGAIGLFALVFGTSSLWNGATPSEGTQPGIASVGPSGSRTPGLDPGIRRKGSFIPPTFRTYFHRQGVSRLLGETQRLKGGDILAFTYKAEAFRYLCVILIDRKGEISWLYPNKPASSIEIAAHGKLSGSVQLDDAPGPERLLAFFSAQPLSPQEVKQLISKAKQGHAAALTLPHQPAQTIHLHQRTIHKATGQ